ncbi:MAG: TetR/AcrR family transcriptional regulator [Gammaproteobacteria bacterium]|nr:MAG: TetR/AcrR family transcriptional regulator [Gammaproteobacteria bacterium]
MITFGHPQNRHIHHRSITMPQPLNPRRRPAQHRSRERVERILATAVHLTVEKGYAQVSMREIARRLGIPVSSLYQYFPSKDAIAATLADHYMNELNALLPQALSRPAPSGSLTPEALRERVTRLVDLYWEYYRTHPELSALWSACQADPALQARERASCEAQATLLAGLFGPWIQEDESGRKARALARWCVDTLGASLRHALHLADTEQAALLEQCIDGLTRALSSHLPG